MGLIYFKLDRSAKRADLSVDSAYKLRVCRPKMKGFHNVVWRLLSCVSFKSPKFIEYQYTYRDEVVAYAQVIHKLFIFRFMNSRGIHVGPCYTKPEHRGKNLYPALLQRIAVDFPEKDIYIFTSDTNQASLRGIKKAGFVPFAVGRKRMHCYVVEKYL